MKKIRVDYTRNVLVPAIQSILSRHYEVERTHEDPQFVFYGGFSNEFLYYSDKCVKICCMQENSVPDFNYCDYAIGTNSSLSFGERYFWHPFAFIHTNPLDLEHREQFGADMARRKFCNFLYSNIYDNEGVAVREQFCLQLDKYKRVDCPGRSLNNMKGGVKSRFTGGWHEAKLEFLRNYKFTIAFENEYTDGYMTEKLTDPMLAGSLPIYYGAENVGEFFNEKAFIDCRRFANFDECIEYIKFLDGNDREYMKMLNAPLYRDNYFPEQFNREFENFLLNIIENSKRYTTVFNRYYDAPSSIALNNLVWFEKHLITPLLDNDESAAHDFIHSLSGEKNRDPAKDPGYRKLESTVKQLGDKIGVFAEARDSLIHLKEYYARRAPLSKHHSQIYLALLERLTVPAYSEQFSVCFLDEETSKIYKEFLALLRPYDSKTRTKIRIGGMADGGCVILDPGSEGFVCSLRVSSKRNGPQRDYELAARGLKVLQIDGKLDSSPKSHPNIYFIKKQLITINEAGVPDIGISPNELLALFPEDVGHNAILVMDLEGLEWDFFEKTPPGFLARFSQIHMELHNLHEPANMPRYIDVLKKIRATHLSAHLHYHNWGRILCCGDFLIPQLAEATFARADLEDFTFSKACFPTELDCPNMTWLPELFIGEFSNIINSDEQA